MNTIKKKINTLLFIVIISWNVSNTMEKEQAQKQKPIGQTLSLLGLCKNVLFRDYYSGLNSLKKTHEKIALWFARLPEELKESLIAYFNQNQSFGYRHTTWHAIDSIDLKPEDVIIQTALDSINGQETTIQGDFLTSGFPQDTKYCSCSLDQTLVAFSSTNMTSFRRFDKKEWVVDNTFLHTSLPLKTFFSPDNRCLAFEFPTFLCIVKNENGTFLNSSLVEMDKNQFSIKYLIGFSKDNYLITHHTDFARLDFWENTDSKFRWIHSLYFPSRDLGSLDDNAHLYTTPSCSQFYYLNGNNELFTTKGFLNFDQITLKLALEKYISENNIKKLYKLKKSKKFHTFDSINGQLMQKYIDNGIDRVKSALIVAILQKMREYNETYNFEGLRSLLKSFFPAKYANQEALIQAQEQILQVAQTNITEFPTATMSNKRDLLHLPLLVIFENTTAQSSQINKIRTEVAQKVKDTAFNFFKELKKKKKNKKLMNIFNTPGFRLLLQEDQKDLISTALETSLISNKIIETKGLQDILNHPIKNPHIITRVRFPEAA